MIREEVKERFSEYVGIFEEEVTKPQMKFIEEISIGILKGKSVKISSISGELTEEGEGSKSAYKRIDRNLNETEEGMWERIKREDLRRRCSDVDEKTQIIIDITDITKRYGEKFEDICEVRDGDKDEIGKGYWVIEAVKLRDGKCDLLLQEPYSQEREGFLSENKEIIKVIEEVFEATDGKGIMTIDRGGDRGVIYEYVIDKGIDFLIRQRGDRNVIYKGEEITQEKLIERLKKDKSIKKYKRLFTSYDKDGKLKRKWGEVFCVEVSLPIRPDCKLYLIVCRGISKEPLILLTSLRTFSNEAIFKRINQYLDRWRVDDMIRFVKGQFELEDIRVLKFKNIQRMLWLVAFVVGFLALLGKIGKKFLKELLRFAKSYRKRRPRFILCSIAKSVGNLINAPPKWCLHKMG